MERRWRRRADSNRRITVLQTVALTTWLRRLLAHLRVLGLTHSTLCARLCAHESRFGHRRRRRNRLTEPLEPLHRAAQVSRAQVRVPEGHAKVGMAEYLLHVLEGRPAHHQVARRGVSEVVEAAADDPGALEGRLERRADLTPTPIIARGEHAAPLRVRLEGDQGVVDGPPHGDPAGLPALRLEEREPRGREVDSLPLEPEDLALSHARMQGQG